MYDGVNIVQELSGASPINSYISAGVDQVFAQQSGTGASATSLTYLTDALGSTIRLTNATGDKVVDYSYDPYGNTKADAVINNSFQYTGRENDGTGLYYYRARYYSPATHRFISEDPIGLGGGVNGYGYVGGNPISFSDPNGLCPWCYAIYFFVAENSVAIGTGVVVGTEIAVGVPTPLSASLSGASSAARIVEQYALRVNQSGFYPIMARGAKEATGLKWCEAGDVWKFGTTKNPATRYSQSYLDSIGEYGVSYVKEFGGTLSEALILEAMKIKNFLWQTGKLPPGNKMIK